MSRLLLDTSVWVEYLRDTGSPACHEVARLLDERLADVVSTPPVVMELLAGARDARALAQLERLSSSLPSLDLESALDFHAASAAYRTLRARGSTVRGLLDCLIGVVAQRHGVTLVHRDADLALVCGALGTDHHDLR